MGGKQHGAPSIANSTLMPACGVLHGIQTEGPGGDCNTGVLAPGASHRRPARTGISGCKDWRGGTVPWKTTATPKGEFPSLEFPTSLSLPWLGGGAHRGQVTKRAVG